jgi:hypothetical protein
MAGSPYRGKFTYSPQKPALFGRLTRPQLIRVFIFVILLYAAGAVFSAGLFVFWNLLLLASDQWIPSGALRMGGPDPSAYNYLFWKSDLFRILLGYLCFGFLAIPTFRNKQGIRQGLRWFRWVFLAASVVWVIFIPFMMVVTPGGQTGDDGAFALILKEGNNYAGFAVIATVLLFVATRKKKILAKPVEINNLCVCSRCGAKLGSGYQFCEVCGTRV